MHDCMQYDPILGQGQGQGHEPLKVGNFQRLSPPPFIMKFGKWPWILKLRHNTYTLSWPVFFVRVHVTLN